MGIWKATLRVVFVIFISIHSYNLLDLVQSCQPLGKPKPLQDFERVFVVEIFNAL